VQTGRPDVATGVDQGLELGFDLTVRVEQDDADLHDAVHLRGQPGGLHVDDGNGHDDSSVLAASERPSGYDTRRTMAQRSDGTEAFH
jgi:hypothetical protein